RRLVYQPYLQSLDDALAEIRLVERGFERGLEPTPPLLARWMMARIRFGQAARRRWPGLQYVRYPTRILAHRRGRLPSSACRSHSPTCAGPPTRCMLT